MCAFALTLPDISNGNPCSTLSFGADFEEILCDDGDPGAARTRNPQLRRLVLYPVELRGLTRFSTRFVFPDQIFNFMFSLGFLRRERGLRRQML